MIIRRLIYQNVFAVIGIISLALPFPVSAQKDKPFTIIALGDLPYGAPETVYPTYEALIGAINERHPDLVIHVGDTKGGGACTDEILVDQLNYLNSFHAPTLYTPGDNEWTDCHRWGDDPLDRLQFIRGTYFDQPDKSFGQKTIHLEHQGAEGYPENVRYKVDGIGFITAHVVGSNNGLEAHDLSAAKEFFDRSEASTKWLSDSFSAFTQTDMIVLAIHADMFEFDFNEYKGENWLRHSGFKEFGTTLKKEARKYFKPVLLIFGDSHEHRVFQPFPKSAPNITAVEVYGYPDMRAVEITLDTHQHPPFLMSPVWNPDTDY